MVNAPNFVFCLSDVYVCSMFESIGLGFWSPVAQSQQRNKIINYFFVIWSTRNSRHRFLQNTCDLLVVGMPIVNNAYIKQKTIPIKVQGPWVLFTCPSFIAHHSSAQFSSLCLSDIMDNHFYDSHFCTKLFSYSIILNAQHQITFNAIKTHTKVYYYYAHFC